jgi:23S rRNA (adenine2503-C2)-methyltransferase
MPGGLLLLFSHKNEIAEDQPPSLLFSYFYSDFLIQPRCGYTRIWPILIMTNNAIRNPGHSLLGQSLEELTTLATNAGQPAYRGQQLFDAIYRQRIERVEQFSTLPQEYRLQLGMEGWVVNFPRIDGRFVSTDGTVRYLIQLADGETVETVWMPEGDGGESGDGTEAGDEENDSNATDKDSREAGSSSGWRRSTICVSSQVGCAVNCKFCFTALLGVKRNLDAGEIVGQIATVLRDQRVDPPLQRVNIVFMGMGEPFLNYENFVKAARLLVEGVGIPESRMTVSTAGIVPRIYDFGREEVRPKLAISLNGSNDALREQVMPLNRKWNLAELMKAAHEFPLRTREKLTFEYVLLAGVNDAPLHAKEVAELLRGMRAKVNLIALNPGSELPYQTPERERVIGFQKILMDSGIPAFVRRPRGRDIFAACGQLKRTVEIAPAP